MKPLAKRVLVRMMEPETVLPSGIVIPPTATLNPDRGQVEAVGKDVTQVAVGDFVVVPRYGGEDKPGSAGDLVFTDEDEIMAVLTD